MSAFLVVLATQTESEMGIETKVVYEPGNADHPTIFLLERATTEAIEQGSSKAMVINAIKPL
jgi:hypothetical protein